MIGTWRALKQTSIIKFDIKVRPSISYYFAIEVTSSISKFLRYLQYSVKKLWYRSMWVWDTISKCWLRYRSFWKVFDIAYTTSILKCFDIGCDIQFQCTSISKFLSFDIEELLYRVRYSIKMLRYWSIQISISKYIHFDIEALRFWHPISKHAASISKKLRYRSFW